MSLDGASAFALRAGDPLGLFPVPDWLEKHRDDESMKWAFAAWERSASVEGSWFDSALADGIVADWPTWARLTTDRFAGVPFKLLPWQEVIVRLMVGWHHPVEVLDPLTHLPTVEHVRLFRRLMLWIPRKNGKTEFLSALGLLFFTMDGLVGGEGYIFARDEKQALIPFNKMKAMVACSPELAADLLLNNRSIYSRSMRGSIIPLTGADQGKHGMNPSLILGDEMHEWRSKEIADTLRQGTGARLQPVELYASTTGRKSNLVGVELWNETLSIMAGTVFDPTTLAVVFAAPQDADYRDEAAWRKANPSLGLSPTISYLRLEAAKCNDNPRAEAHFRCYHLNQWIEGEVRWLPLKKWDACTADPKSWKGLREKLKGRRCFGAFDISSTQDITALVWVFPPTDEDPQWYILPEFWVPAESLTRRVTTDKVPYDQFVRAEAMNTTPGDYVDQNYVMAAVLQGRKDFDVQSIGFDPWNATKLVTDLHNEGVEPEKLIELRQGIQTLGEMSKHFEKLVFAGLLDHGGHPVLRWMAENVVVRFDENLNYAPTKKKSVEKIDGIVAGVMATGLALAPVEEEPSSPWDDPNYQHNKAA